MSLKVLCPSFLTAAKPCAGVWPWRFNLEDVVNVISIPANTRLQNGVTTKEEPDYPYDDRREVTICGGAIAQSGIPHYLVTDSLGRYWWIPQIRIRTRLLPSPDNLVKARQRKKEKAAQAAEAKAKIKAQKEGPK